MIPARIDRLPWSKFRTRMVAALGVAWILDGLEITIASNVGPGLTRARRTAPRVPRQAKHEHMSLVRHWRH